MSKKKINIVLILAVLGLWGTVLYRTLNRYLFPNQEITAITGTESRFDYKQIKKDTFKLESLNYDPFLNNQTKVQTNSQNSTKPIVHKSAPMKRPTAPKQPAAPIQVFWPQINYYGYIKSAQKTNELILIKINNTLHKARKNDNIDGVEVKRIFKDSIEIRFSKETKFIYLNR